MELNPAGPGWPKVAGRGLLGPTKLDLGRPGLIDWGRLADFYATVVRIVAFDDYLDDFYATAVFVGIVGKSMYHSSVKTSHKTAESAR